MNNKAYLKTILENIDKEYPNSAMVYGLDKEETNPPYVFVILDDNNMYFGKQVSETDELTVKRVDIDKISKVSFVGNKLSVQIKDGLYDLFIDTDEEALRAICKEFKIVKNKEASKHLGNIMDHDFEERKIPEKVFSGHRTDISPYGIQNKPGNLLHSGEHKGLGRYAIERSVLNDIQEEIKLDAIRVSEEPVSEAINKPIAEEDVKETENAEVAVETSALDESLRMLFDDISEPNLNKQEKPFIEEIEPLYKKAQVLLQEQDQVSRDILLSKPASPTVVKSQQPLSKKEQRRLEKEEEMLYGKKSDLVRSLFVIVFLLIATYFVASYYLSSAEILYLPLHNLPAQVINMVIGLTQ